MNRISRVVCKLLIHLQFCHGQRLTDPVVQFHGQVLAFPFFAQGQLGDQCSQLILVIHDLFLGTPALCDIAKQHSHALRGRLKGNNFKGAANPVIFVHDLVIFVGLACGCHLPVRLRNRCMGQGWECLFKGLADKLSAVRSKNTIGSLVVANEYQAVGLA